MITDTHVRLRVRCLIHAQRREDHEDGTKNAILSGTRRSERCRTERSVLRACCVIFVIVVSGAVWPLETQATPQRIISLVPAVTEMLFAIGAGPRVIAVSSYDREPPEVEALPRVGALLDPDVERILSLRPDLVVLYGSQDDLRTQMGRAGIAVFDYRHGSLAHVTDTIRALGVRTGYADGAEAVAAAIEVRIAAVMKRAAGQARPRTLLVFGRERGALRNVYVSGGRGFLHDALEAAGGVNVFADVDREAVQATTEVILARAPEVIVELRSSDRLSEADVVREVGAWARLASVPAVRQRRIHILTGAGLTVPGPRVAETVERLADALHGGMRP
jgi:iron complex transport system substrate-binding protein